MKFNIFILNGQICSSSSVPVGIHWQFAVFQFAVVSFVTPVLSPAVFILIAYGHSNCSFNENIIPRQNPDHFWGLYGGKYPLYSASILLWGPVSHYSTQNSVKACLPSTSWPYPYMFGIYHQKRLLIGSLLHFGILRMIHLNSQYALKYRCKMFLNQVSAVDALHFYY